MLYNSLCLNIYVVDISVGNGGGLQASFHNNDFLDAISGKILSYHQSTLYLGINDIQYVAEYN